MTFPQVEILGEYSLGIINMILYCRHAIPLTANCTICTEEPMDITEELLHYSVCIKKWDGKLKEALAAKNYEEAGFYARAVGNEYSRLSLLLHTTHQQAAG